MSFKDLCLKTVVFTFGKIGWLKNQTIAFIKKENRASQTISK
jgi:hypothetical protein